MVESSVLLLLPGETFNYRVRVNGYTGPWFIFTVPYELEPVLDVSSIFTEVTVVTPNSETTIQIKKLDDDILSNGDSIVLPAGVNDVRYRAIVDRLKGPWKTRDVPFDQTILIFDTTAIDFGTVLIEIPNADAVADGAMVEFRKIFDGASRKLFADGELVSFPLGVDTFDYRVVINNNSGPWEDALGKREESMNDNDIIVLDTAGHFVTVVVDMPQEASAVGAIVKFKKILNYDNDEEREFQNGDSILFPARDSVDWRIVVNGIAGEWTTFRTRTKPIFTLDVSDGILGLQFSGLPTATDADTAPPSIEIQNAGILLTVNSEPLIVPFGVSISWRALVNGYKGGWEQYNVPSTGSSVQQMDVQDEFCLVTTTVSGNSNEVLLNFVGGDVPKDISASDDATLHFLAGDDVRYRVQGVSGQTAFNVPNAANCPATLSIGSQGRMLLRHGN